MYVLLCDTHGASRKSVVESEAARNSTLLTVLAARDASESFAEEVSWFASGGFSEDLVSWLASAVVGETAPSTALLTFESDGDDTAISGTIVRNLRDRIM